VIVLSFLLVIIAAVALVVGLFLDSLGWIWASIAACLLALLFLGIGVLQRRGAPAGVAGADEEYKGSASRVVETGPAEARQATDDVAVVPKRTVRDARETIDSTDAVSAAGTAPVISRSEQGPEPLDAVISAKRPTRKAATKKAATKTSPAKKAAATATPSRSTAKKAAKKTTGAAARRRLSEIKGLGEKKALALIKEFGSLEAIREASVEELAAIKGIGRSTAEQIRRQL
jgi:DNA uptake protein ComE-like DNA-binding protein